MPLEQWSFNSLGCEECCEKDNLCRVYLPCCLRGVSVQFTGFVINEATDELSSCIIKRMTLRNNCNSLESLDWSNFQVLSSRTLDPSDETVLFAGRGPLSGITNVDQGCDFGVDIELEHLFCPCDGGTNFTAKVTVCNPHDDRIIVRVRDLVMSISFETLGASACNVELLDPDPSGLDPVVAAIEPGDDHEFVINFGTVTDDWQNCFGQCYSNADGKIIVEGATYLPRDGFDTTCLRHLECFTDLPFDRPPKSLTDDCEDAICPPCGCVLDLVSGCGCGCGSDESMNACDPPKKLCSGCTEDSGSITLCESRETSLGVGSGSFSNRRTFMECWRDSDCTKTAELRAPQAGGETWTYIHYRDGGLSTGVSVNETADMVADIPSCEDWTVSWGIDGSNNLFLTINGTTKSVAMGANPLTGGT